jgi:hypothetical protein
MRCPAGVCDLLAEQVLGAAVQEEELEASRRATVYMQGGVFVFLQHQLV